MADLNKTFLMGRLTQDVNLKRTSSGTAVTELQMASNSSYQGKDGERRETTLFIGVTVWGKQAEHCAQYLRKGSSIHVEGSLRTDSWDDRSTGQKRYKTVVNADRVQFLDGKPTEQNGERRERSQPRQEQRAASRDVPVRTASDEYDDEDPPF